MARQLSMESLGQMSVQDSQMAAKWDSFLKQYCTERVHESCLNFPEVRSVQFPFTELQMAHPASIEPKDPSLSDQLLAKPHHMLRIGTQILFNMDMPVDPKPRMHLRVNRLPGDVRIRPRHLRAEHLGKLVAVQGIITAASDVHYQLYEGCFDCKTCGNRLRVMQEDERVQEPVFCDGCEKPGPWTLRDEESRHIDAQIVRIQEPPESIDGGETPAALTVVLHDDLVHSMTAGARVIVNGIVALKRRSSNGKRVVESDPVLIAVSVEHDASEVVNLESTPAELDAFRALAKTPTIHQELAQCIVPSVLGLPDIKLGIIYALAGSPSVKRPDGTEARGRIHVLLAGDPGVAKSKLLFQVKRYVPRCIDVLAQEATRAGLSAAVIKDETTGRHMLEPGALALGHGGFVVVDELNALEPEDQVGLHTSMEEGFVGQNKVVKATLPAAATVLAGMNPIHGRFDRYNPFLEQLGITPALRSRFDLTFCPLDIVDHERDRRVASAIIGGTGKADVRQHYGVILDNDQLRRYLHQARKLNPTIPPNVEAVLVEFYANTRSRDTENPAFSVRQADGLRRLAMASARLRLSSEVSFEDAERAIQLVISSLHSCRVIDSTGRLDGDLLQTGRSRASIDRHKIVLQLVKDHQRRHPDGERKGYAKESDLVQAGISQGINGEEVMAILNELRRTNVIYLRNGQGTYAILTG